MKVFILQAWKNSLWICQVMLRYFPDFSEISESYYSGRLCCRPYSWGILGERSPMSEKEHCCCLQHDINCRSVQNVYAETCTITVPKKSWSDMKEININHKFAHMKPWCVTYFKYCVKLISLFFMHYILGPYVMMHICLTWHEMWHT